MAIEVAWSKDMPREVRAVAEPLVEDALRYLPSWVQHLSVRYGIGEGEDGVVAVVEAEYPYRQVKVRLTPHFLTDSPRNRKRAIVHEFMHSPIAPIRAWVIRTLQTLTEEDDALRQSLFNEYHDLEEGAVQDLTFAILPPRGAK